MSKIYTSAGQLIGKTPLLELVLIEKEEGLKARILGKLEYFNPAESVKDRIAKAMIDDVEISGKLKPGSIIIEPISDSTGTGLAFVAAARGCHIIAVMPDTVSVEHRQLMKAYGAELVLTPGAEGMTGAIARAHELAKEIPGSILTEQLVDPDSPAIQRATTGPEIWEDTDGNVDVFVADVGAGGTVIDVCKYLKNRNPDVKVVAVEPASSPAPGKASAGAQTLQGTVSDKLSATVCDEVIAVGSDDALATCKKLDKTEGVLAGFSSGAVVWAAIQVAKRPENRNKNIVVLLTDIGDRRPSSQPLAE